MSQFLRFELHPKVAETLVGYSLGLALKLHVRVPGRNKDEFLKLCSEMWDEAYLEAQELTDGVTKQ